MGLEPTRDSQDSLIRHLNVVKKSIREVKTEWTEIQATLMNNEEIPKKVVVEKLLREIVEELLPCLKVKQAEVTIPGEGETVILSFHEDVQAVIKEIIVGGLSELPDHGPKPIKIDVTIGFKEERAEVRFVDNTDAIKSESAEVVNRGSSVVPDERFQRDWGLSVAQHVALRGGGRLVVEPSEQGNIITYLIPIAYHG